MSVTHERPDSGNSGNEQREQLDDSFDKATAQQPKNYRDEASDEKKVEIGRDKTKAPIKGLDAPEAPEEPDQPR